MAFEDKTGTPGRALRVPVCFSAFFWKYYLQKQNLCRKGVLLTVEIKIDEETKTVYLWLPGGEENYMDTLKPLCAAYHRARYMVCIFESGDSDLCETLAALLRLNRRRQAEQGTPTEKQAQNEAAGQ